MYTINSISHFRTIAIGLIFLRRHPVLRRIKMGKKLYVGNLSFNLKEDNLINLFSNYGSVETAKIITDRDTGRSKGFAFIEMSHEEDAKSAINALNGKEQDGRALNVSIAKPMASNDKRSGGFRNRRF